ncbi:MAG: 5-formyltetrahydrofolate cyclo-ligase [Candidatus Endonucleobacter bathymodioli]|uniref:5-formyltetrahydrofolate cyclo-ligase n=1 Tax=Candidatus Endonucleibacter bathymodioli TaxID=539814 RepID=A0AA90NQP2_9GAMM|nr:5-formyltetrahydrofolate cyclo-ligase [Candidatus Endonucleobacter bathymodioli]
MDQKGLRAKLRRRRKSLSDKQQLLAQKQLSTLVSLLPEFLASIHIALYFAQDGEINPMDIAKIAWSQGKTCYLPILDKNRNGYMYFLPYKPDMEMQNNKYGIPEPVLPDSCIRRAEDLDLVLVPLTGFDEEGRRMGMGGGYYDRTFAFKKKIHIQHKPLLMGIAHECQKVEVLSVNTWDLQLAGVATDQKIYNFIKPYSA